ncbi:MAG: DUF177 domain-containing protein [Balneolia bacterium]|nr:DUF177 domain-containing protein [Balneolia bacterium]
MKFRISDIPDSKSVRELTVSPSDFSLGDIEHDGIDLKVQFTKILNTLQVRYDAKTNLQLTCDRSLEKFSYPVDVNYVILFKPDVEDDESDNQAIRQLNVSSNIIDIEQEVRDSILLSIPIKKLHPRFIRDDGTQTEYTETFGHSEEPNSDEASTDPRWDALKQLKNKQ